MLGWQPMRGEWMRIKDAVIGRSVLQGISSASGLLIVNETDFGTRFEMEAVVAPPGEPSMKDVNAGLAFYCRLVPNYEDFHTLTWYPKWQVAAMRTFAYYAGGENVKVDTAGDQVALRVMVWDNEFVRGWANEQLVYGGGRARSWDDGTSDGRDRVGLGGLYHNAGDKPRWISIRIRKLSERPSNKESSLLQFPSGPRKHVEPLGRS
jgi:hypothetical protein